MMTSPVTTQPKTKYKLTNWKAYNRSLSQRGSITLWLEAGLLREWGQIDPTQKVVGQRLYPHSVIQCCLLMGMTYHQPLRQTTGLVASLLALLGHSQYAIPDYSTLCRRQAELPLRISQRWQQGQKLDIALDSTGLKVYGEGEWKVRQHGVSKGRVWRKLHIGIDVATQEIVLAHLTTYSDDDAAVGSRLLSGRQDQINSFRGDGAYDDFGLRQTLGDGLTQLIPPPKDAVHHKGKKGQPVATHLRQRNEAVTRIERDGRAEWKKQVGYHRRSLNEAAMFRYKTSFGDKLRNRKLSHQQTEAQLKVCILNAYRDVGMPVSYPVL